MRISFLILPDEFWDQSAFVRLLRFTILLVFDFFLRERNYFSTVFIAHGLDWSG